MTYLDLEAVKPGMVVAADVEGKAGQILLRAGTRLSERQIGLLAANAIGGIEIRAAGRTDATALITHATGAGRTEQAADVAREAALRALFRDTDTTHPFIQALMRAARARMLQGNRTHERSDTER